MTGGEVGVPNMTFGFCGTASFTAEPWRTRAGTGGGGGETCRLTGLGGGVFGRFRSVLTPGTRKFSLDAERGYELGFRSALVLSRTQGGDFSSVLSLWLTST